MSITREEQILKDAMGSYDDMKVKALAGLLQNGCGIYDVILKDLAKCHDSEKISDIFLFVATSDASGSSKWLDRAMQEVVGLAKPDYPTWLVLGLVLGIFKTLVKFDDTYCMDRATEPGKSEFRQKSVDHIVTICFRDYALIGNTLPTQYASQLEHWVKMFYGGKAESPNLFKQIFEKVANRLFQYEGEDVKLSVFGLAILDAFTFAKFKAMSVAERVKIMQPLELYSYPLRTSGGHTKGEFATVIHTSHELALEALKKYKRLSDSRLYPDSTPKGQKITAGLVLEVV